MTKILKPKITDWGFYGMTKFFYSSQEEAEKRWVEAFTILKELSNLPDEVIRRYLDSKAGDNLAYTCRNADGTGSIKKEWDWFKKDMFSKDYKVSDKEFYNE